MLRPSSTPKRRVHVTDDPLHARYQLMNCDTPLRETAYRFFPDLFPSDFEARYEQLKERISTQFPHPSFIRAAAWSQLTEEEIRLVALREVNHKNGAGKPTRAEFIQRIEASVDYYRNRRYHPRTEFPDLFPADFDQKVADIFRFLKITYPTRHVNYAMRDGKLSQEQQNLLALDGATVLLGFHSISREDFLILVETFHAKYRKMQNESV